jgi:uncharacterized protein (DUF1778 family)
MSGEHSELSSILKEKDLEREGRQAGFSASLQPLGKSKRSLDMLRQFAVQYSEKEGPFMASPQHARIEARVSPEQKELFERAAAIEGVTLTDFAISTMHRAATSVVQEHTTIELSVRNQRAFVEALRNPPEPNEALREAAKAYMRMK